MKKVFTLLLFLSFLTTASWGQPQKAKGGGGQSPFVLGIVQRLQSVELGEERVLNIYLPEGYSPDSVTRYPVIYLLDGSADEDFIHVVGVVQFLTMIEAMPKSIVVGIANVDRRRDFTFPTAVEKDKKAYPTTGGSAKFIKFIEGELQPFVEANYKTTRSKTIIGQSLGGLLATEILLKAPALFSAYIIVSPSLWWDNESLLAAAPGLLQKGPSQQRSVYVSVGSEGAQMEGDAKALVGMLGAEEKKGLHLSFVPLPAENHLTILHNSVYTALKTLY